MSTLYKNIIILEESDTKLIGDFEIEGLMEADSDGKTTEAYNESVFAGISDVVKLFNNDKDTVSKVNLQLTKNQKKLSGGKLKDLFLFFATKLVVLLSHGSRSIIKAINFLWSGSGGTDSKWKGFKALPGLSKVTGFVSSMVQKTGVSQLKIFNSELKVTDLVKFITVMFVLVGSIGFIVKKIKEKVTANNESIDYDIETMPLVLTEGDSVGDSFIKKGAGALAKLVNFMKNVGDKVATLLLGVVATIIATGILLLTMFLTRGIVLKAIKFVSDYQAANKKDPNREISALDKAKYIASKVAETSAKVVTFSTIGTDLYLQDPEIDAAASMKAKQFITEADATKVEAARVNQTRDQAQQKRQDDSDFNNSPEQQDLQDDKTRRTARIQNEERNNS